MDCPQLPDTQSAIKGHKRLETAEIVLGRDVLTRFLIYALYLLGFKREALAEMFGYQLSGVKSIVDRVGTSGLEGLQDRRRTVKEPEAMEPEIKVQKDAIMLYTPEPLEISFKAGDFLARKVVASVLADSEIISPAQGAALLDYTPQAFNRLLQRYRQEGSLRLIDQRKGQRHDYKVDLPVKSEILYHFVRLSCLNEPFSSKEIHEAVSRAFPEKEISERTIRHHLTLLGFSAVQKRLKEELFRGKKN